MRCRWVHFLRLDSPLLSVPPLVPSGFPSDQEETDGDKKKKNQNPCNPTTKSNLRPDSSKSRLATSSPVST